MSIVLGLLLLREAPPAPPGVRTDCEGRPLATCPRGATGPACDLPCAGDLSCDYALYCHSHGGTYGLSTFGAHLFAAQPGAPADPILSALRRFVADHPADLGLDPGLDPSDLDLRPAPDFRADAGALSLLRFEQYYREVPVVGPDARVTLVAGPRGVLALRGAIVDPRIDYAYIDSPADVEVAHASILAHAELWTGQPAASLRVADLRLVAVPRARALGWAGRVSQGLGHLATVVVEADPDAAILPLLSVTQAASSGLADPAAITVLAEDPDSDVLAAPTELDLADALRDGSPLLGAQAPEGYWLASETLVALDATDQPADAHPLLPMLAQAQPGFAAAGGSPRFLAQDAYVALANAYRWTELFMAGRWESTEPVPPGEPPLTPPGQFRPRLHVLTNPSEIPCDGAACFQGMDLVGVTPADGEHFLQPLDEPGPRNESMGRILMPNADSNSGGQWKAILLHEFGHFVDNFARPGMIDDGFACLGADDCAPSCVEDSTDESAPLKETWAQIASILYLRSLYAVGADPERCDLLPLVSRGTNAAPHRASCRAADQPFSLLLREDDPLCPGAAQYKCVPVAPDWPVCRTQCDKPHLAGWARDGAGAPAPTGLCQTRAGYGTDSLFQALWELLHAEECADDPPYDCVPMPALAAAGPEGVLGEALHYALRVNTATYRGFFDDVATHIACNAGPAVYAEVDRVLCHHHLRPCDAPLPALCESCGNGVREGDEACDGADLGGAGCEALGLGGALVCTPECTLDASTCSEPAPAADSSGGSSGGEEPAEGATATAGEDPTNDGCDCTTSGRSGALALAALLGLRRRRRALIHLALAASTTACGGLPGAEADAGTSEETLGASTGAPAIDPRYFDVFRSDHLAIGDENTDPERIVLWSELELQGDGTGSFRRRVCARAPETTDALAWTFDADAGVLRLQPNADGKVRLGACTAAGVELALGESCGELWIRFLGPESCGPREDFALRYLPGRVCPEVQEAPGEHVGGEACFFAVTWCDERPLPACQAP